MPFLLIIRHDAAFRPTAALVNEIQAWVADATARGVRLHGAPLRPAGEAVTVRVRGGEVARAPGPPDAAPEPVCAYEHLACDHLEEAVALAASHPMARVATLEVRQVWDALSG